MADFILQLPNGLRSFRVSVSPNGVSSPLTSSSGEVGTLRPTRSRANGPKMSNVRKGVKRRPDPPCVVCLGSGRIDCHQCRGKGRTNHIHLEMLPKGEWPKWCRTCGGSGLDYCPRCLGTGEYRYVMGFRFMNVDHKNNEISSNKKRGSIADLYEEQ
ncbi:uncharacterized protein LOC107429534 isoform X1 [Ziziphus jujuba]|uniref:Uncharacterized protein LOC107429534 isoform X1 n=2 Tax=Ziziphus jujuba TaxID=326968 RepID=A0ABM3I112_ZIZJJ|nr:uncharacterized protein LOC107429534 isoform X1 [Ziziphus jujuba]